MSDHVIRRFHQHNSGYEKTTKPYRPFLLIYSEEFPSRQLARDREKYLKTTSGKRFLKNILIEVSKFG
jgi:putative endonuclease